MVIQQNWLRKLRMLSRATLTRIGITVLKPTVIFAITSTKNRRIFVSRVINDLIL
jgi:hypothetical protein